MASEEVLEDLKKIVQKIMTTECVDHYDLNIEGSSEKGENFVGDILFFNVVSKKDGHKYNLVMKTAKRSEVFRQMMCDGIFYKREVFMYTKVFPAFKKFGQNINPSFELDFVPRVFGAIEEENHESLILENLKTNGYKLWDKTKPMNMNHILPILTNYGKLHAMSLVLNDQRPEVFQGLLDGIQVYPPNKDMVQMVNLEFKNALNLLSENGWSSLADKFVNISKNFDSNFMKTTKKEHASVILHGDCWNNNFMFKYEDEKSLRATKACFVDFQMSTFDSPIKDLSYFIYTACDGSALKQLNLLLKTYYDSLSASFTNLGGQSKNLFTFEELKGFWKEYSIFGVLITPLILKVTLSSSEDTLDLERVGKETEPKFKIKPECEDYCFQRLIDLFSNYADMVL